ncbi:GAF domain-containing protein [Lysobacter koreensis]|uniref:histidine kinase n=1 Tax=Lysobacter koreensis TaxID=266122 RepID=A0ABW2YJB8_9GAMM
MNTVAVASDTSGSSRSPADSPPAVAERDRALLERQRRALEMVVRGEPLADVLTETCLIIEAVAEQRVAASISLVDDDRLVHGAAPSLPAEYNAAIDNIPLDPDLGTCAAAAARRQMIVTEDIANASGWSQFAHWPLGLGLRAAWSMPILGADGEVLAAIGTYFPECRAPTQREVALVSTLAQTAGLAIERARADEAVRQRDARHAFISGLEAAIQPLGDARDILDTAARKLAEFLDGDRCAYATAEADGVLVVRGNFARHLEPVEGRWPLAAFGAGFEQSMLGGRSYVVNDSDTDLDIDPAIRDAFALTRIRASITVPLLKDGALTAVMAIHQAVPRRWKRHELEVTEQVVARCWEAVERARVTAELRDSEARYRAMVEANPECVKLVAPDGTLLQMNDAGLKLIEALAPETAVGQCVYNLIAPEFREAFRAFNDRVCSGERGSLEFELIGLQGTRRWMATSAVPLAWPGGGFAHLAVTRDVTERVLADRALADSRARLDYAVRLSGIGFWYCDLPFDELVWDAKVKEHFFLPADARVTIDTFFDCIHPDDREATRAAIDRSIAERTAYDVYYRTVDRATGAFKWIRALGGSYYGEDGAPIRFDGVTVDASSAKLSEDRLAALLASEREQARLLGEVAQAARTIHASTSVDSVLRVISEEARRIIGAHQCVVSLTTGGDWSQAIVHVSLSDKYAGYRGYDAVPSGRGIYSLVCETNTPMRLTQEALEAHPRWRQFSGNHRSHPPIRGWLAVPLIGHDGANIGLVQMSDRFDGDFSEIDQAVLVQLAQIGSVALENSRLYEMLREQDRRKDEFIATLAHELRNPLAPIRTGLTILARDQNPATRAPTLAMMDRQLDGMVRLVDDLLDVSRITLGKLTLERAPTDLRAVLDSALETARPLLDKQGHRIEIDVPADVLMVDADPARLAQILANLLNNAAKYTDPGGHIRVIARRDGDEILATVSDDGVGIPSPMLERVFDLFTQVESSGVNLQSGLGIGLTLVRRLVELHGGTVSAASAGPGQGSAFTVRLPAAARHAPTTDGPAAGAAPAATALRILVVDDNHDAAAMMRLLLEMESHLVRVAGDGPQALEVAAEFQPDLIFLDIGLPGLSGYEVAARLRAQMATPPLLVAVTGWGTEEDRRRAREVGFDEHLVKPVDPLRILELVADLGRKNRER